MKFNKVKKIDIRKVENVIMVDTETIGAPKNAESVFPFDISYKVVNLPTKQVLKQGCLVVKQFFNNKFIMGSTFSFNKIGYYQEELDNNNKFFKLATVRECSKILSNVMKKYNIELFIAHNAEFDLTALDRLFNEFECSNPFNKINYLDTMEISKVITFSASYKNFCLDNQEMLDSEKKSRFITGSGRVKTTAEAIYCYTVNNPDFLESHTGLEDISIEKAILDYSLSELGNSMVAINTKPAWSDYSVVVEND